MSGQFLRDPRDPVIYLPVTPKQAERNRAELLRALEQPPDAPRGRPTPGEKRILRLLAHGFTTTEIDTRLRLDERTVHLRIADLTAITETRNTIHLIATAIRRGWLHNTTETT